MSASDSIAAASLVASFIALCIAWYAIGRANKTTSAATFVTLNEGFRQAWIRFLDAAGEEQRHYELAELMNLYEIACAIYLEKSLTGNSRELVSEYLNTLLKGLLVSEFAQTHVPSLLEDKMTFKFIKQFHREKPSFLSVTVPPKWYQSAMQD